MLSDLLAARMQMAMSLAFHIVFAAVGIAMPLMMALAEWHWLRRKEEIALTLAKRWAQGTAILFAVGAVSGTVLSFELGLLWPSFMEWAGGIIGLLFALEGFAFFTEAIFLGIYLYGWTRVPPYAHLAAGVVVAASGAASAVFVVTANAWMNTPTGFLLSADLPPRPIQIDPIAAMRNPAALWQVVHMLLAAYAATGLLVAGIHAFLLLRDPRNRFHQLAFSISLLVGGVPALLQPLTGDLLTRMVAEHQPVKLAAFEGLFQTEQGAAFRLGGIADMEAGEMRYALEIPGGLSLLLHFDPDATVQGLDAVPLDQWPPVGIVHLAFQAMVASGVAMAAVSLWAGSRWWRRRSLYESRPLLWAIVLASPLGFLAIEAGWTVTEVGRQPWIIQGVMRTAAAVTPMPGLIVPLITMTALYLFLSAVVLWLLFRHIAASPQTVRRPPVIRLERRRKAA
ncbi:MAG: cytochrome ubiquinol oxidase subunit I [Nitrospirota bacterium]